MSMPDSVQLLRAYAERGDEAAFRELVARYIDLVHSVAVRRVGGDVEAARDVTQSVFIDLARKARSLRGEVMLGGWLHRHTGFVAASVARAERRRQAREQQAAEMNTLHPTHDPTWQQLAPVLDETIDALDAADRQAILLRFFEQRDFRAVGAALGISDDAAQKRVSRAVEKLRTSLARRGVTLSLAALAAFLTAQAVSAAPAGLAVSVSQAALAGAAASAGIVGGLTKLITSLSFKLAAGTAAVALVTFGLFLAKRPTQSPQTARPPMSSAAPVAKPPADALAGSETVGAVGTGANATAATSNQLILHIVAADSGQPIPMVTLDYWVWENNGKFAHKKPLLSTRFGVCAVPVPWATITQLILVSQVDDFADTRLEWRPDRGEVIPAEYTLRVARSVPFGGRVVDADGQPVAGAQVGFNNQSDPAAEARPQSDDFGWPFWITATTGNDGRWQIDRIAKAAIRTIYGGATHPQHVGSEFLWVSRNPKAEKQLLAGTYVFKLGRAVTVRGLVVDPDGQPVPDAQVAVGRVSESGRRETKSEADGSFSLVGCKPGRNVLSAEAKGFAPTTRDVELAENSEPFRLTLQSGHVLRLRVVDKAGLPVPKASIWLDTFEHGPTDPADKKKPSPVQSEFNRQTGSDGRLEWQSAPDAELDFNVSASGYMRVNGVKVRPDGEEHTITLPPALTLSGTVRDAANGQPIPRFRIIIGWPSSNPIAGEAQTEWSSIDRFWLSFEGGKFRHVLEEPAIVGMPNPGYVFKFEADGYAPFVTRSVRADEGEVQFDVALRAATSTAVTVVLPDGGPAANTDIGLVSPGARLSLVPGGFSRRNMQSGGRLLLTDEEGRFDLPPDEAITRVIAAHAAGYAEASPAALAAEPTMRLQPWGRLEGTFLSGGKPAANRVLTLGSTTAVSLLGLVFDFDSFPVETDAQGRFAFPKVPPGRLKLTRLVSIGSGASCMFTAVELMVVEIRPGETTTITVGGSNYTVTAHLRWPTELKRTPDWRVMAFAYPAAPPNVMDNPDALATWQKTPDGRAATANIMQHPLMETSDGAFVTEDVAVGRYILYVQVFGPAPARTAFGEPRAWVQVPFTVPADPPSGTLDLGEIVLKPAQ